MNINLFIFIFLAVFVYRQIYAHCSALDAKSIHHTHMEKLDLSEIPSDGESIKLFDDAKKEEEEKETPAGSQPEETKENETEAKTGEGQNEEPEENIPFHKHPRFKALVDEKNEYKEQIDLMSKQIEDLNSKFAQKSEESKPTIPSEFRELFGEQDPIIYEKFKRLINSGLSEKDIVRLKEEIREEIHQEQQQIIDQENQAKQWVETQVQNLEADLSAKGEKLDKNKLFQIMRDFTPTDEQGNLDFEKGYQILKIKEQSNQKSMQNRKEIADQGKQNSVDKGSNISSEQLRKLSWDNITNLIK